MDVDLDRITREIRERDSQDSGRELAPLKAAADAHVIDSSAMSIDEVLSFMMELAGKRM
jgi:cytidylate kinase